MRRDELRHLIRAACRLTGDRHVIVMGSQAVLGSWKEIAAPERVTLSNEADIAFFADPDEIKSDTVMGVIDGLSPGEWCTRGYPVSALDEIHGRSQRAQ